MTALIAVALVVLICLPIYLYRRKLSKEAQEKWEQEESDDTTTIYVRYGKFDIPILKSQQPAWDKMKLEEKWWMLEHLKVEVQGGRLTTEKKDGTTKFVGITNKAKDIKHRQNTRNKEWYTSKQKN